EIAPVSPRTNLDAIRTAKRLVAINGRTQANAVVMHPTDAEALVELKDSQGRYLGAGPFGAVQPIIWGIALIESEAVPAGTALIGDFTKALILDREQTTFAVGTVNDDFVRNIARILAEMRAGFIVTRP